MTEHVSGKTAFITGAGRGLGAGIALELAKLGARLIIAARSENQLAQTAEEIRREFPDANITIIAGDLSDHVARNSMIETLLFEPQVDILINNAAIVEPLGSVETLDPDALSLAFDINVITPMLITKALLPGMVKSGWGRIVNISTGVVGHPASMRGGNAYVAAKAALEAHSLNLAAELDGSGVTVNIYRPGIIDTAMQQWIREQDPERIGHALHERFIKNHEAGALLSPTESAQAMLRHLLITDQGSTGGIWDVNETVTP